MVVYLAPFNAIAGFDCHGFFSALNNFACKNAIVIASAPGA
jgi:hypothetical protein